LSELGHFVTWVTLCVTQDDIYHFGDSGGEKDKEIATKTTFPLEDGNLSHGIGIAGNNQN
jgi:hypothetical protein